MSKCVSMHMRSKVSRTASHATLTYHVPPTTYYSQRPYLPPEVVLTLRRVAKTLSLTLTLALTLTRWC